MNDTIRVSDTSVMYQGIQPAVLISKGKVRYCQIRGEFKNDAIRLTYQIDMKASYVKKCGMDLVKDRQAIIQKRGKDFFILFDSISQDFAIDDDGKRRVERSVRKPDYSYSFRFEELDEEQVVRDTISTNARDVFNGILKQYGIRGEADGNPSDSYMASWKIGHPESEIKE